MPYIINKQEIQSEFRSFNQTEFNKKLYSSLSGSFSVHLEGINLPDYIRLVRCNNRIDINVGHFELALLDDRTQYVAYYVRVITKTDVVLNSMYATQVLVWRSSLPRYTNLLQNLTGLVFESYIMRMHSIVVSDVNQSTEGINFWYRRLLSAQEKGFFTYAYDILSGEVKLLHTPNELFEMGDWLWGEEPQHQTRVAIISQELLKNSLPNPQAYDEYIGKINRIPYGPLYEVIRPVRELEGGDWLMEIFLFEFHRHDACPLSEIKTHPEAD
ncbi:DUF5397 family protein [Escherichia fergusonii]|uniref:DUF5397 family protein n=1 Tax=Escherichia fergusonii TaxID=564 RepID=UPI003F6DDBC8